VSYIYYFMPKNTTLLGFYCFSPILQVCNRHWFHIWFPYNKKMIH
jgi:hypothetical protein